MSELVKVAVDAMGGDFAPVETVKGAIDAVAQSDKVKVYLVGRQEAIEEELKKYTYDASRVEIVHAEEVIETAEPPVMAIRKKKDSSMVKALNLVKSGECDAFVSAGSTGATLVGGQLIVGKLKGIERPPLAPMLPTANGISLLVDCGANVDARPSMLLQFAKMGSIYMENICGVANPKVGILNIGAEEEKGNALVKETFPLLKNCPDINFIGSVEARDVPLGLADVIVCDAFAGNVALKMYEGTASFLLKQIKTALKSGILSKIGALLILLGGLHIAPEFRGLRGGAKLIQLPPGVIQLQGFSQIGEGGLQIVQLHFVFVKFDHIKCSYFVIKNNLLYSMMPCL